MQKPNVSHFTSHYENKSEKPRPAQSYRSARRNRARVVRKQAWHQHQVGAGKRAAVPVNA